MCVAAEFRGPGVHHNFEDSDSGYEMDADNKGKSFGVGGYRGRIIFLGDGTEVLTDSDDTEMFDNADEDKDLDSQVPKGSATAPSDIKDTKADVNSETQSASKPLSETPETKPGASQVNSEEKTTVTEKGAQESKKD